MRDTLSFSVSSGVRALGASEGHPSVGRPHPGGGQSSSRLLVEGEISPIRMDFESPDFSEDLSGPYSSTGDRPVCGHSQLSISQVLFPLQGSPGLEGGRTLLPVVRPSPLCLPTFFDSSKSPGEDCSGRSRRSSGGPVLASETLVPEAIVSSGRTSQISSSTGGSVIPTYVSPASSKAGESSSLTLAALREKGKQGGLSARAAEFSAEALRESTRVTYDSKLECFFKFHFFLPLILLIFQSCLILVNNSIKFGLSIQVLSHCMNN